MSSLVTISRRLCEDNMEECHKRAARYHPLVKRENWSDDRGNLSRSVYIKGRTCYSFTVLNGELIAAGWEAIK